MSVPGWIIQLLCVGQVFFVYTSCCFLFQAPAHPTLDNNNHRGEAPLYTKSCQLRSKSHLLPSVPVRRLNKEWGTDVDLWSSQWNRRSRGTEEVVNVLMGPQCNSVSSLLVIVCSEADPTSQPTNPHAEMKGFPCGQHADAQACLC